MGYKSQLCCVERSILVPSLSKNYDAYLSFYSNKLGLLTLGSFYKSIDNLIYNSGNTVIDSIDIERYGFPQNLVGTPISKLSIIQLQQSYMVLKLNGKLDFGIWIIS